MRKKLFVLLSLCLVAIAATLVQIKSPLKKGHPQRASAPNAANARIVESYGKLPLSFEANQGQTDAQVKFLSRGSGYSLFLTSNEAVLSLKPTNQSRDEPGSPAHSDALGWRNGASTNPPLGNKVGPLAHARPGVRSYGLWSAGRGSDRLSAPSAKPVPARRGSVDEAVLRMKLVGANPSAQVTGLDELPGKSNYFIGNDPKKWRTNVPTYAKVRYENVYPGIDLLYYGNQRQLEYDFVVSPGADPRTIRLAFPSRDREGAGALRIDDQGDLLLGAEGSELRLHKPVVYQEINGERQSISGKFVIQKDHQVGFEVARYDASKPLIIDPVLVYSTYLGGSGDDRGSGIAVDSSGNAYVTGLTLSSNFPTTSGAFQTSGVGCFVTKFNPAGTALAYSTLINNGECLAIAVDSAGNAYVTGDTQSTNFPTANAFQAVYGGGTCGFPGVSYPCPDAFVTKLNATGSALVYSTYLGGSGEDYGGSGQDYGLGIAVDSSGNAYVTGYTSSTNFPTKNAFQAAFTAVNCPPGSDPYPCFNAFVTKLNAAGSALVYSTYLGGSGDDNGSGIAVDSSGNAYVTGYTHSTNFPTTANAFQPAFGGGSIHAFVTKLNAAGSALVYSTYLGGSGGDYGQAIAVDASGNAYVTGQTFSANFPTTENAFQAAFAGGTCVSAASVIYPCGNAFVTKLNAAGSALVYSTYLGGSGGDSGSGIAVDSSGNAYVTGSTGSTNFPTANAFQAALATCCGYENAFVTKLNAAGSALVYSTYLGGSGGDWGSGIAVDSSGNAYVTGTTQSTNFPTLNAFQPAIGSHEDAFVTKLTAATAGTPPTINPGGVLNNASYAQPPVLAPGTIVEVFGTSLTDGTTASTQSSTLPTTLAGARLLVNGVAAPLFSAAPGGINAQLPVELVGATSATIQVEVTIVPNCPPLVACPQFIAIVTSPAITVFLAPFSPGIFTWEMNGQGPGAILHNSDYSKVCPPGRSDCAPSAAARGEVVDIFMTGLGQVNGLWLDGLPNPQASPTATTPTVTIGGVQARVAASGLAQGYPGLYQVNVYVPQNAPTGNAVPVVLSIGGVTSNTVTIAVQ